MGNNVKCESSTGCQPCNISPWYNTDGGRCVCGPASSDWIHKDECTQCSGEKEKVEKVEASGGSCPWWNNVMCESSTGCQPCNISPWYNTDGGRCVCGPASSDWIFENQCSRCSGEEKKVEEKVEASGGSCPWWNNVMCESSTGCQPC